MMMHDNRLGLHGFQHSRLARLDHRMLSSINSIVDDCAFMDAYCEIKDDLKKKQCAELR